MSKKTHINKVAGIIVIAAIAVGAYMALKTDVPKEEVIQAETNTNTQEETKVLRGCEGFCVQVSEESFFKDEKSFASAPRYSNPDQNTTIEFKALSGVRNSGAEVFVNGTRVGEVNGQALSLVSFSPDYKYFAFRTRVNLGCAGKCQNHEFYSIDIERPYLMRLVVNPTKPKERVSQFQSMDTFIEAYSWGGNRNIFVRTYPVALTETNVHYRVNFKETWLFDLSKPQGTVSGTIFKTLSE